MNIEVKRQELYDRLIKNETKVELTNGRNKDKIGVITRIGQLRNYKYGCLQKSCYNNYFQLYVQLSDKVVSTSCDYIQII